jgi:hypothetical protein
MLFVSKGNRVIAYLRGRDDYCMNSQLRNVYLKGCCCTQFGLCSAALLINTDMVSRRFASHRLDPVVLKRDQLSKAKAPFQSIKE